MSTINLNFTRPEGTLDVFIADDGQITISATDANGDIIDENSSTYLEVGAIVPFQEKVMDLLELYFDAFAREKE